MARRFGGRYSPGAGGAAPGADAPPPAAARPAWGGLRRNLLYVAPLPLLLTAFGQGAVGMAADLGALALLLGAAALLNEGVRAEEAYGARTVARRPAIPRKLFATVLTGAGVALAAVDPEAPAVAAPLILAAIAAGAHVMAFGLDPMRDKGADGIDAHQSDRVARAVDEAERTLSQMHDAILRARDRALETRVARFQGTARAMFRAVEADPRDLTAARRYLGVYLDSARDATVKFADLWARTRDPVARTRYEALLDDLEQGFAQLTRTLAQGDRAALDIEIDVLRERLQRDGIRHTE